MIIISLVWESWSENTEADLEEFYNNLEVINKITKKNEINVSMGDWDATVGESRIKYGEVENDHGARLMHFCHENNLFVANTSFKLINRRLYTWRSPQDNENNIVRNQIDFVIVSETYRN